MIGKYAVGIINFFDNDLIIEIIDGENWKDAFKKHTLNTGFTSDEIDEMFSDDLDLAKNDAFNMDMMIDVTEIK